MAWIFDCAIENDQNHVINSGIQVFALRKKM